MSCHGWIKGNPDIAGVGVISAVFGQTLLVIVISITIWWSIYVRKAKGTTRQRFALKALTTLGDVQLLTALAIAVGSTKTILQSGESSLYHIFVARVLVDASVTGHHAAIVYSAKSGGRYNWRIRIGLISIFLVIYLTWTGLSLREFNKWNMAVPMETPYCFDNDNIVPGTYTDWIKVSFVWVPLVYAWVFLQPFEKLDAAVDGYDEIWRKWPKHSIQHLSELTITIRNSRSLLHCIPAVSKTILHAFSLAIYLPCLLLATFISAPAITLPIAQIFFFIWPVYELITVRSASSNRVVENPLSAQGLPTHGNENPENDLGFGQILALVLLVLPLLQTHDTYEEVKEESSHLAWYRDWKQDIPTEKHKWGSWWEKRKS